MTDEKTKEEFNRLRKIERDFKKLLRQKERETEEKLEKDKEILKQRYQERMDDLGELIANVAEKVFKKARRFLK